MSLFQCGVLAWVPFHSLQMVPEPAAALTDASTPRDTVTLAPLCLSSGSSSCCSSAQLTESQVTNHMLLLDWKYDGN